MRDAQTENETYREINRETQRVRNRQTEKQRERGKQPVSFYFLVFFKHLLHLLVSRGLKKLVWKEGDTLQSSTDLDTLHNDRHYCWLILNRKPL